MIQLLLLLEWPFGYTLVLSTKIDSRRFVSQITCAPSSRLKLQRQKWGVEGVNNRLPVDVIVKNRLYHQLGNLHAHPKKSTPFWRASLHSHMSNCIKHTTHHCAFISNTSTINYYYQNKYGRCSKIQRFFEKVDVMEIQSTIRK